MTQDQEIREAVEKVKEAQKFYGHYNFKELNVLLTLAQRYLSCSSMMPSKKEVGEMRYGGCNPDEDRGYNEAIEACTLALMKKCEGITKVIEETNCHIPEIGRRMKDTFHPSLIELLSTTIQQYLTGSGKWY